MNSDPYDSAAWRSFGMLDADEAAIFDEAMREDPALLKYSLEMDRLSAAIAACTATPIAPESGLLRGIQNDLKLATPRHHAPWFAISGWAAAAAMAGILAFNHYNNSHQTALPSPALPIDSSRAAASPTPKSTSKVVTKRLTQEIEVLRENLEKYQHRDHLMFAAVPGMAMPIVMTMTPPGVAAKDSPIPTLLGDAAKLTSSAPSENQDSLDLDEPSPDFPTAMSIYDAARDFGTLIVHHLPAPDENEVFNLWVVTESGGRPIYLGSLPESSANGIDSFDFSLGSTMILPSGFILTQDPPNAPANPTESNIVLQGPPTSPN